MYGWYGFSEFSWSGSSQFTNQTVLTSTTTMIKELLTISTIANWNKLLADDTLETPFICFIINRVQTSCEQSPIKTIYTKCETLLFVRGKKETRNHHLSSAKFTNSMQKVKNHLCFFPFQTHQFSFHFSQWQTSSHSFNTESSSYILVCYLGNITTAEVQVKMQVGTFIWKADDF